MHSDWGQGHGTGAARGSMWSWAMQTWNHDGGLRAPPPALPRGNALFEDQESPKQTARSKLEARIKRQLGVFGVYQ